MNVPDYHLVQEKALSLGFQKVAALVLPQIGVEGERLKDWLGRSFHAEMHWMAKHLEKRLNPLSLMPGTQTILCVAMNYYPGGFPLETEAQISRYAQGTDYHRVLQDRLGLLLEWLKEHEPRIEGRPLTDSAPLMEKALAVQAGLGWQGKHSNLITRDLGSWVFLGELLLNVTFPDTPQTEPLPDLCGSCRRCIDACPTNAIVEPYVVDANQCISYWTIEYRGETFPETIASNLNGWVFGCDICQEVCPWNIKFQQETSEADFHPLPWNQTVQLAELATMSPELFQERYRDSPLQRTKHQGLQRNAQALLTASSVNPE